MAQTRGSPRRGSATLESHHRIRPMGGPSTGAAGRRRRARSWDSDQGLEPTRRGRRSRSSRRRHIYGHLGRVAVDHRSGVADTDPVLRRELNVDPGIAREVEERGAWWHPSHDHAWVTCWRSEQEFRRQVRGAYGPRYAERLPGDEARDRRSEEHTSELQSHHDLVCRLLLEKKKKHDEVGVGDVCKYPILNPRM